MKDKSVWQDKKILITGATGFIGSVLATELNKRNASVYCMARNIDKARETLPGMRLIEGDILDVSHVFRTIENIQPEFIFHLAGAAIQKQNMDYHANIAGTKNILHALMATGEQCLFIFTSSDSVYGAGQMNPYVETDVPVPHSPYAVSKYQAEQEIIHYANEYDINCVIARLSNVYGPQDKNVSHLVTGQLQRILAGEPPVLNSNGKPVGDFIYIDDIVEGLLTLGEHCLCSRFRGDIFNLCTGIPTQVIDVVNTILELTDSQSLVPTLNESANTPEFVKQVSAEKCRHTLGWAARTSLVEGLKKTINEFK